MSQSKSIIMLKVCLVGDGGVGKSSIRRKIIGERFKRKYLPTVGSDFSHYQIKKNDKKYKVMIWDFAGDEQYKESFSLYFQGAHGCLLIFDLTNRKSFTNLHSWVKLISNSSIAKDLPIFIMANKKDLSRLQKDIVEKEEIIKLLQELDGEFPNLNFIGFSEVSANLDSNIESFFNNFIDLLIRNS